MTIWTDTRRIGFAALALCALALAGCGGEPRRINPPIATIQQLAVDAHGQWRVAVRLQNFSNVPMHFAAVNAQLDVGGVRAGAITFEPALDIPPESVDVAHVALTPRDAARSALERATSGSAGATYRLEGTIRTVDPNKSFEFAHDSTLSPVPGRPGEFR